MYARIIRPLYSFHFPKFFAVSNSVIKHRNSAWRLANAIVSKQKELASLRKLRKGLEIPVMIYLHSYFLIGSVMASIMILIRREIWIYFSISSGFLNPLAWSKYRKIQLLLEVKKHSALFCDLETYTVTALLFQWPCATAPLSPRVLANITTIPYYNNIRTRKGIESVGQRGWKWHFANSSSVHLLMSLEGQADYCPTLLTV